MSGSFKSMSFAKKVGWLSIIYLVVAAPFVLIFSRPGSPPNSMTCLAQHEFSFLQAFTFKISTYNEECGEAQATLAIMNAGLLAKPPNYTVMAVALGTWRLKYPRIGELISQIASEVAANPQASSDMGQLLTIPPNPNGKQSSFPKGEAHETKPK